MTTALANPPRIADTAYPRQPKRMPSVQVESPRQHAMEPLQQPVLRELMHWGLPTVRRLRTKRSRSRGADLLSKTLYRLHCSFGRKSEACEFQADQTSHAHTSGLRLNQEVPS